jgi:hypothetical protein
MKICLKLTNKLEELNLRFERLSMKFESRDESRENEKQGLITSQFKSKYCNYGLLGHNSVHFKAIRNQGNRQSDANSQPHYCVYCRITGYIKTNFFLLIRRNEAYGYVSNNVRTGGEGTTADVVFNSMS